MLKMYHRAQQSGEAPEFWESTWSDGAFAEALRFCEVDPLRPLFEKYGRPGVLMLEGGCGRGQYVTYYSRNRQRVVGLDFAVAPLGRLKRALPSSLLCGGDVAALPFRDEVFDIYYSGGVVEHIESGPQPALSEAHRVLKPGGSFLVSVPHIAPLRRVSSLWMTDRRWTDRTAPDPSTRVDGLRFFQYAFSPREFRKQLELAGFEVLSQRGYSIVWGLMELPLLGQLFYHGSQTRELRRAKPTASTPASAGVSTEATAEPSLLKRLAVSEDDSVPLAGWLVRMLRWFGSNMMMYECLARK